MHSPTRMAATTSILSRSLRTYQIYGANTDVGKTILSTVLCKSLARLTPRERVWYLKPVSTGPADAADDGHLARFAPRANAKCLFQFDEAVSPHIAARRAAPTDASILQGILGHVAACSAAEPGTLLLETAGGVHSPSPSGSSQADLYRPLRLPVLLVADSRLGGISGTISAFESLHIRGYDLDSVLIFEDAQYRNHEYLRDYFAKRGVPVLAIPAPPPRVGGRAEDEGEMAGYYERVSGLDRVEEMIAGLRESHDARIDDLEGMAARAHKSIWYPFTQHQGLTPESIMTIDSAHGDFFQALSPPASSKEAAGQNLLTPTLDGSASWWTQGVGHGNVDLALAAAHAAGRYGHVMFAGAVHAPALQLAERLLEGMQNPRLQKVFYSDNGSTGMEVATKMALTAASARYGHADDLGVLGLKGSYHGDTVGAMDCSEPSPFNAKVHWYAGRGHWFDFPQVAMTDGKWVVAPPAGMEGEFGAAETFASLDDVFDVARDESEAAQRYEKHILETLHRLVRVEGRAFGALIMEPVILGAGGMLLVDPLFQRTLVNVVRANPQLFSPSPSPSSPTPAPPTDPHAWRGLPIVFDEVFTGLYRLGRFSSASLLAVHPDISVHAKLLTGGLLPLCATLASDSVYAAFLGAEKQDALLHGHSYTAHAVGCAVANQALEMLTGMEEGGAWKEFQEPAPAASADSASQPKGVWSMWSAAFVDAASRREDVEGVIALGSVLAIRLHDTNSGYNSGAAAGLQEKLGGVGEGFAIHSRVLGNVLYLMASQTTEVAVVRALERRVLAAL